MAPDRRRFDHLTREQMLRVLEVYDAFAREIAGHRDASADAGEFAAAVDLSIRDLAARLAATLPERPAAFPPADLSGLHGMLKGKGNGRRVSIEEMSPGAVTDDADPVSAPPET